MHLILNLSNVSCCPVWKNDQFDQFLLFATISVQSGGQMQEIIHMVPTLFSFQRQLCFTGE